MASKKSKEPKQKSTKTSEHDTRKRIEELKEKMRFEKEWGL